MSRGVLIAVCTCAALALAGVWGASHRLYFKPAAEWRDRIAQAQDQLDEVQARMDGQDAVRGRMDALGATMLAGAPDEVEHRLREGLTEVSRRASLTGVALGNGRPAGERSPVPKSASPRSPLARALRARPDFEVVRGWMTGTGTLEQVCRCLAILEAQPWVHRVEGFSVTPANADRTEYKLRVDFATLVSDVVQRTVTHPRALTEPSAQALDAVATIAMSYPFGGRPTPVAGVIAQGEASEEPGPPYERWMVTGLIEGARSEALLIDTTTGERAVLLPGQSVLDARFEGGEGEVVVFSIAGRRHSVMVGQTLGERREETGGERRGEGNDDRQAGAQALGSEERP